MIQENTPSETVVYTAEAVDPDGLPVRMRWTLCQRQTTSISRWTPKTVIFGFARLRMKPPMGAVHGNEYWVSIIATQGITDVRQRRRVGHRCQ